MEDSVAVWNVGQVARPGNERDPYSSIDMQTIDQERGQATMKSKDPVSLTHNVTPQKVASIGESSPPSFAF